MKKIYFTALLGISSFALAQQGKVGINTETPAATLEINPNTANALTTATTNEGLLIPRVSRLRAANMASPATSTLIYINSIADGSATGTTASVDAVGFYYYNGTAWTKLNAGGVGGTTQNWEQIRSTGIQTITTNDQTIAGTTWFADVSGSVTATVRLPAVTAADAGKMVTIFKSDVSNLSVTDSAGVGPCSTCALRGTVVITSNRGKSFVWTGTYWAPVSY